MFLDLTLPEQVNEHVFSHRYIKSDCKAICVKDVFPHLYIWCPKISTFGMCFHKHMGTRMCILMKMPKWQGNSFVFPAPITIVLGNVYVLKTCFFYVSSKLKSVAVVYRSSTPEPLFLPETLQISRSKAKETTCSGKNGTSQNHMTVAKQKYKS